MFKWFVVTLNLSVVSVFGIGIPYNTDYIVAKDGSGNFATIQQAIDSVQDNNPDKTLIYIKNGIYKESVVISSGKKNVVLYGEDDLGTIITYTPEATDNLPTLAVYAEGFIAYNLTIENTAGPTWGPAQALLQEGDKSIYINCRIIANQDTYFNRKIRSYCKNCYFEGTVDFIFGEGTIVFEDCILFSKGGSAITAASTKEYVNYGYVFRNCHVVSKKGTTTHLGRPWREYAAVAFINCELPDELIDAGWHNWDKPEREVTARFAEYRNYGPGADTSQRVDWAKMLTADEAGEYATLNVLKTIYSDTPSIDNWNPYSDIRNAGITGLNTEGNGYGMNEGGNGGTTVTVDNETDLKNYASSDNKYIVQVSGNIQLTGRVDIGSNTTITGLNEKSGITGGTLNITKEKRNVIIKYLNITNPNGDGISVWNGNHVFITHISFYDCGDGCCDINRGSDSVTVSWCKFYYPNQKNHRFTMIADGTMTWNDNGEVISYGDKLHLTLHHNWWYSRSDQRMPASTNTRAHIYNNYWNCINNYYCSNARHLTEFLSENNYYDNVNNPSYAESGGQIYAIGNVYNVCSGNLSPGTDSVFTPQYPYTLSDVNSVPDIVTSRAGNVWENPRQFMVTALSNRLGKVVPNGTHRYNEGQLITLEAEPYSNDYTFTGWNGYSTSNKNPLIFYADSNYEISPVFESTAKKNDQAMDNEYCIYPNPSTSGIFYLNTGTYGPKEINIEIFSLQGILVYRKSYRNTSGPITVQPNLDAGIYLIRIDTNREITFKQLNVN